MGTYSTVYGQNGQRVAATSHNGCCYPSWLNPLKLSVSRNYVGGDVVVLASDSGGATIGGQYHIQIFNKTTGALVQDCPPGSSGITRCSGGEVNPAASTYQAVVSLGGATLQGALGNDSRAASYYKCVDPAAASAPTPCKQTADPLQ